MPPDFVQWAEEVDEQLQDLGGAERAVHEKKYLKSDLIHYGVPVPKIRAVVKPYGRRLTSQDELLAFAGELWQVPIHERRFAAAALLQQREQLLSVTSLVELEEMLRAAKTWALVDTLTPYPIGRISQREPVAIEPILDRWSVDPDFWIRRAALLSHLIPLREGDGDWSRFTRYAEQMLPEKEFFIRKAIGWILRDTSRQRPEMVLAWVEPRAAQMSGVTIREAVKYLQPADRDRLLALYKAASS